MDLIARAGTALLAAALAAAALPAVAAAEWSGLRITSRPVVAGVAQVGGRLEARDAAWTGRGPFRVRYTWVRCAPPRPAWNTCSLISGAPDAPSYVVAAADEGHRILVWLTVWDRDGRRADAASDPTAVVAAAPLPGPGPNPGPNPGPTPDPDPGPGPSPSPEPNPGPDPNPEPNPGPGPSPDPGPNPGPGPNPNPSPQPAPNVGPEPSLGSTHPPNTRNRGDRQRRMRPFPIVRIRGWLTPRGAMITLLTVRAPKGVKITVRCRGRSCPRRALSRAASARRITRLRPFEGVLRAGTRLVIRVTRPGFVGKHTVIRIRRGRAPSRRDRCLYAGSLRRCASR